MLTLGRMAWKEGGGNAGWRGALNIALNNMALGPPWWKKDKAAKNVKFCYNIETFSERYKEEWALHEEWKSKLEKVEKDPDAATEHAGAGANEPPQRRQKTDEDKK